MVLKPTLFHQLANHWSHQDQLAPDHVSPLQAGDAPRGAPRFRQEETEPGPPVFAAKLPPRMMSARSEAGPWFLGPQGHPKAVLVKPRPPLQFEPVASDLRDEAEASQAVRNLEPRQSSQFVSGASDWQDEAEVPRAVQDQDYEPDTPGGLQAECNAAAGGSLRQQAPSIVALDTPESVNHSISYSNLGGVDEIHETKVLCHGDRCESMSQDVVPTRPVHKTGHRRLCAGHGPLVWDGLDRLAHRIADSARNLLGFPGPSVATSSALSMPGGGTPERSEGESFFTSYTFSSQDGHAHLKHVESRCQDGVCVQRSRTFTPGFETGVAPEQAASYWEARPRSVQQLSDQADTGLKEMMGPAVFA
eukprot:TRINITY_DN8397_c0_g1_i1.p1 TRINITY_DN8397_c0_g1~~TRINITY_DN8397_c0_g1_i1.p1  ORF type:complete len:362 (-),score=57.95 TRINITY_DN8397_c0_g1_i1:254-1339(-)